jgi:hypothetical protein
MLAHPRAAADEIDTSGVQGEPAFSVIPRHCYVSGDAVRAGPCRIRRYGHHRPTVIVWGDSHAAQQIPALRTQARQTRTNLIAFSMGLCPPMVVRKNDPDPCSRNAYGAIRFIERKAARSRQPLTVVLGGFWHFYRSTTTGDRSERAATFRAGDDQMFARLAGLSRRHGVRVVVVDQAPWIPPDSKCSLHAKVCSRSVMIPEEASQTAYLTRQLRAIPQAQLISVADQLCSDRYCRVTSCDVPVFFDTVHLNSNLTARFSPLFDWAFRDDTVRLDVTTPCGVAP